MSEFESIWKNLQRRLEVGTVVKNWTAFSGDLGDSMTVTNIDETSIEIEAPKAMNLQNVPRGDFEKVWEVWKDYKAQKVKRYELRDMTRFSKYIISLLHWNEEEGKNGEV